jgi:hypothetical protein
MLEWLQFIQYGALQIVRKLMKEASTSGKSTSSFSSRLSADNHQPRKGRRASGAAESQR